VHKADNLPLSCADVKKSGGRNLPETCGPVQACYGTALLFFCLLHVWGNVQFGSEIAKRLSVSRFYPKDGGSTVIERVASYVLNCMA
jgi:hypothetical protein